MTLAISSLIRTVPHFKVTHFTRTNISIIKDPMMEIHCNDEKKTSFTYFNHIMTVLLDISFSLYVYVAPFMVVVAFPLKTRDPRCIHRRENYSK